MARLAFKPDASFFKKIAMGAVGARAVAENLNRHGHRMIELERGSTDTKLWKDVKRKRVRMPDLVCRRCALRIESRAKTKPELAMSHSDEAERSWDYGMVDEDLIAFPICQPIADRPWSSGCLSGGRSYWHERNWVRWEIYPFVNFVSVAEFRRSAFAEKGTKGVTEGSETQICWPATFSTRDGVVEEVDNASIRVRRTSDGHPYTWRLRNRLRPRVVLGQHVGRGQILASAVSPLPYGGLGCAGDLAASALKGLCNSRERSQRFTGVKLARVLGMRDLEPIARQLAADRKEDVYIRLEAAAFMA